MSALALTRKIQPLSSMALLLLAALLGACGRTPALPQITPGQIPAADSADSQLLGFDPGRQVLLPPVPVPPVDSAALPAIQSLEPGERAVSVSGPGYQVIPPQRNIAVLNFAEVPDGKLESNSLPPFAYSVYALQNFPADSFPTDLKVTTDTTGPEYWVAFADFEAGRWVFNGPFNASAQVEIPYLDKPGGLHDYVSEQGRAMFMVLAPEDNDVVLAGLELGVDGGSGAPLSVILEKAEGEAGVVLRWRHSLSFDEADFAGYLVERAPLLGGSFVALGAAADNQTFYFDSSGELDEFYRYRVASLDTSGNRSNSNTAIAGRVSGQDTPPVLLVDFDPGPFEGARTVSFDFSASFDPDGTPIDEYRVLVAGAEISVSSAFPVLNLDLPAGCLLLNMVVVSNLAQSERMQELKIYPTWQPTPVTVAAALPGGARRLDNARMRYLADGQQLALVGFDAVSSALAVHTGEPGSALDVHRVFSIVEPEAIDELELHDGSLIIPVHGFGAMVSLAWSPEEGTLSVVTETASSASGFTRGSVLSTGTACYAVHSDETAGLHEIQLTPMFNQQSTSVPVFAALVGMDALTAVYNAGANAIDIVYADTISTEWLRWSLDSGTVVDSENLSANSSLCLDLEINPATGEPAVCYHHGGRVRYREYDGASWSAEELIDNNFANFLPFDLCFAHGTRYCFMAVDTGYGALYEFDSNGPAWVQRNSPANLATVVACNSILPGPQSDQMLAAAMDTNPTSWLLSLLPGDADNTLGNWDASLGAGLQLRAAGGSDGLHAVWLDGNGKPYHYLGANDGTGWTNEDPGFLLATSVDIGAQADGEVYLSFNNADFSATRRLDYWDPMTQTLSNEINIAAGAPAQWPFIGWSAADGFLGWYYFDNVAGNFVTTRINQTAGPNVDIRNLGPDPVWLGASSREDPERLLLLRGGPDPWDGEVNSHNPGTTDVDSVYDMILAGEPPLDIFTTEQVRGRTIDGAPFLMRFVLAGFLSTYIPADHYAIAQGPFLNTASFDSTPFNEAQMTPSNFDGDLVALFLNDMRKTVSVMDGPGLTGVELISSLGGDRVWLRWSNYGEWEELPLPVGLVNFNRPELVKGSDGRWHILYHDWQTDEIMCLSSN